MGKKKTGELPSGKIRYLCFIGYDPVLTDKNGNPKRNYKSFTGDTMREAKAKANEYKVLHKLNHVVSDESLTSAFDNHFEVRGKAWSPTTLASNESIYSSLVEDAPSLMKKKISNITADDIQILINDLIAKGNSNKTIKNKVSLIKSVLRRNKLYIDSNDYIIPDTGAKELYVPTDEEVSRILAATKGTCLHIPCLLATTGPLREGEICGLDIKSISGNEIHVFRTMYQKKGGGFGFKDMPKNTSSIRTVVVSQSIIDEIFDQGYVTDLTTTALRRSFTRLLDHLGIQHFRFHDLRHWCVSTLHAQGIPDAYIMQRGGWSNDKTLKAVYRHVMTDQQKIITDRILSHFDSVM